ncbi:exported hypothetical protein [Paraburkholderia ribeironis]|uniref:Uncharacterized protein n=1 Tax=Paraburkholderia ribeironis TaxID=1247936 RepID=A0A1N7SIQ0_9BURK|nr:hypothetical protein [Paraburkholderia ribeironis]SIT47267.1 exported hypothetical protein [Paraburkholderia ribeironis]
MKPTHRRTGNDLAPTPTRRTFLAPAASAGAWLALAPAAARAALNAPHGDAKKGSKEVVLVVQTNGPHLAIDQMIAAHLGARGYRVRMLGEASPPDAASDAERIDKRGSTNANCLTA